MRNIFKMLKEAIKNAFADPFDDPRCSGCVHIDGPVCPYPNECSAMLDLNKVTEE